MSLSLCAAWSITCALNSAWPSRSPIPQSLPGLSAKVPFLKVCCAGLPSAVAWIVGGIYCVWSGELSFHDVQLMRHCRKHLLLHLIPSPSGFFVAGLEGGGPRDEKSQRRRCISARFLSLRGFRAAAAFACLPRTYAPTGGPEYGIESIKIANGPVLCLARPRKIQQNTARRHGHVESVPQLHPQAGPCSAGFDHLRQVSCAASFAGCLGPGPQERIQPAHRARTPLHQGPKVRLAVALAQPDRLAQEGAEAAVQRQQAFAHGLPSEGIVRTTLELRATRMGPALLRQLASLSEMATPQTLTRSSPP